MVSVDEYVVFMRIVFDFYYGLVVFVVIGV